MDGIPRLCGDLDFYEQVGTWGDQRVEKCARGWVDGVYEGAGDFEAGDGVDKWRRAFKWSQRISVENDISREMIGLEICQPILLTVLIIS